MLELTFGEQVKIILSRKGMTIKELAEKIEKQTGKKMSRQNLTQRLGRDNFQEQDMRMIAQILGCQFHLSIMVAEGESEETQGETVVRYEQKPKAHKKHMRSMKRSFQRPRKLQSLKRRKHLPKQKKEILR